MNSYDISDDIVGGGFTEEFNDLAKTWVAGHFVAAAVIIIVLTIVVLWLWYKKKEKFTSPNPTTTMGLVKWNEAMEPSRNTSFAAGAVDNTTYLSNVTGSGYDPTNPNSINYSILHSPDWNCNAKTGNNTDAYAWMANKMGSENMEVARTDNDLSKILSGRG